MARLPFHLSGRFPVKVVSKGYSMLQSESGTFQKSQYAQSVAEPGTINFRLGQPAPLSLPTALMRDAAQHVFGRNENEHCDPFLLQYAVIQGYVDFRTALAEFLTERTPGSPIFAEQLMMVAGVSQGIDVCARRLAKPGDIIFVEDPTYFLSVDIFRAAGLQVQPVPTDDLGMLIDETFEARVCDLCPSLLYCVPIHNNPRGSTLPADRRRRLLQLAEKYGFTIIADEVYQLMGFTTEAKAQLPLREYDQSAGGDTVVSLGSFSKLLAPSLRLGWINASATNIQRLAREPTLVCGGGMTALSCAITHAAIQQGLLAKRVPLVIDDLSEKCEVLCAALDAHICFPGAIPAASYYHPQGGYFVWLQVQGIDANKMLARAKEHGVAYLPGALATCTPHGDVDPKSRGALRLAFSFYTCDELAEGVRRLATVINEEYQANLCKGPADEMA